MPRVFAIHLIARGRDEQNQEWVFKEFMSPGFTWEDVVEGRTIVGDSGDRTECGCFGFSEAPGI